MCIRIEFSSRRIIRDTNMEAFPLFGDTRWPLWAHVKSLYKRWLVSGYKESCNNVWPPLIIIINFISIASIPITVLGPYERSRQECRNFESWIVSRCIHFEPERHQTLYDGAPDFSVNCNLPNASHVTNYLFICSQLFSPMKKVLHTSYNSSTGGNSPNFVASVFRLQNEERHVSEMRLQGMDVLFGWTGQKTLNSNDRTQNGDQRFSLNNAKTMVCCGCSF